MICSSFVASVKSILTTWSKWIKPRHGGMSLNLLEKMRRKLKGIIKTGLLSSSASWLRPDALRYLSTIGKICFPPNPCESLCMRSYDRISCGSDRATVMNAFFKKIHIKIYFIKILTYINWPNAIRLENFFSLCRIKGSCFSNKLLSFKTRTTWPGFGTILELILWHMTNRTWF